MQICVTISLIRYCVPVVEQGLQIKIRRIRRHITGVVIYALQIGDCSDITTTDKCRSTDRGYSVRALMDCACECTERISLGALY